MHKCRLHSLKSDFQDYAPWNYFNLCSYGNSSACSCFQYSSPGPTLQQGVRQTTRTPLMASAQGNDFGPQQNPQMYIQQSHRPYQAVTMPTGQTVPMAMPMQVSVCYSNFLDILHFLIL